MRKLAHQNVPKLCNANGDAKGIATRSTANRSANGIANGIVTRRTANGSANENVNGDGTIGKTCKRPADTKFPSVTTPAHPANAAAIES